jgi:hypothetical protein
MMLRMTLKTYFDICFFSPLFSSICNYWSRWFMNYCFSYFLTAAHCVEYHHRNQPEADEHRRDPVLLPEDDILVPRYNHMMPDRGDGLCLSVGGLDREHRR